MATLCALFLDVDGVINSRFKGRLDKEKLERLRRAVLSVPNCVLVISSHWRLAPKLHRKLCAILTEAGMQVIGATPAPFQPWLRKRPLEMCMWLSAYHEACSSLGTPPVTNFVAIDDRNLLAEEGGEVLRGRFVNTDPALGMTDEDALELARLLIAAPEALPPVPGLSEELLAGVDSGHTLPPFRVKLGRAYGAEHGQYVCSLTEAGAGKQEKVRSGDVVDEKCPPKALDLAQHNSWWRHRVIVFRNHAHKVNFLSARSAVP